MKNNKTTKMLILFLVMMIFPIRIFAYSNYIVAGGENIGIELKSQNVIVVGTYKIGNENPANKAGIISGDKILKVNNQVVNNIDEMVNITSKTTNNTITIEYERNKKNYTTSLQLVLDQDNVIKTGLYVKDSITGVGTLTFIDPNTHIFGALGHEIIDNATRKKFELKDGTIYSSTVTGITPSNNGNPGEKNARYNSEEVYGNINKNTPSGVFGKYTDNIKDTKLYKVAENNEVSVGKAKILTVIDQNNVEEFNINILKINKDERSSKNILFEVDDENLLKITGGIVQGMSGSPIIQEDKIIGAVTHVVVDDPTKGYGIFITTMLKSAEN